ncbi:sodium-dependent transporter [Fulvivirga lutimaris]|uniref:sodium-dependent transporter n=1 Tax=Fulvivirga lutimaris TaxID=1819566 RepID=UPI0012BD77DA|nr:sodium-dependent transporter [Fulvivirga lutimaris]MTI39201.1 sodium-dependent transporter [Fulvivirga lutimaris]
MSSRGNFSSKIGFIAAASGSAVGLGNIWRFPFEVANGGGAAFLIIYINFCFLLCLPLMITEIAIGRKTQRDASSAFAHLGFPKWSILGKMGILASIIGLSLYYVIAAWSFGYFLEMLIGNFSIGAQFNDYIKDVIKIGFYGLIFLSITAFIVSKGISGGVEKASKILMPALLVLLIFIACYALTLPNAFQGISFYLVPDFSEIKLPIIYTALGQAFFSLSLGMAIHITFGSFVSKNDNILSSASAITLTDVGVAFLAGIMIFPIVAYQSSGVIEGVNGGPGLIFQTLPSVFESLGPWMGVLIGSCFFLLLTFAALTSAVSLLEVPVTYLVDQHKVRRNLAVILMTIFIFLLGIPSLIGNGYSSFFTNFIQYGSEGTPTDFLTFLIHTNDVIMLSGGFLISIFGAYKWGKSNLNNEIAVGNPAYKGSKAEKLIKLMISYFCPIVLGLILILTILDRYFGITLV